MTTRPEHTGVEKRQRFVQVKYLRDWDIKAHLNMEGALAVGGARTKCYNDKYQ